MGLKDLSSQQLGKLGETAVALELMKRGYDVINLNESLRNYKHADLLCASSISGKTTLIQVKTGSTMNIQCGLTSTPDGVIDDLDGKVLCPWVFVHANPQGKDDYSFEFYVLTRDEVLNLIKSSNDWYANQWSRKLKHDIRVGVDVRWLDAKGSSDSPGLHPAYTSSLTASSKNRWDKISL